MSIRRRDGERPLGAVPRWVQGALLGGVAVEIAVRLVIGNPGARAVDLEPPPGIGAMRAAAMGEPIALAYGAALRLQSFDNQPGVSLPFASLDYDRVEQWLASLLALDPVSQYPLVMASHLYAQVSGSPERQRAMAAFVHREFLRDPGRRWPWLAHVAIMARHRLGDMPLAIRYADAIRDHANLPTVPAWARQMHIFLREDAGEREAARALLGGLLASGTVTEPHEIAFLTSRLEAMQSVGYSTPPTKP
jgi:hypothetical protein